MTDHAAITDHENHVRDQLSSYLNGDLSETERSAVEAHLEKCATCRQDLATLRLTLDALHQLPALSAPRDFSIRPKPAARWPVLQGFRVPVGAIAAALVLILGYRLVFQSAMTTPSPTVAPAAAPNTLETSSRPAAAATPTSAPAAAPAGPPAVSVQSAQPSVAVSATRSAGFAGTTPPTNSGPESAAVPTTSNPAVAAAPTGTPYPAPAQSSATQSAAGGSAPGEALTTTPYPAPGSNVAPAPTGYPSPAYPSPASGGPTPSVNPTSPGTPVVVESENRATTWFTPALGILVVLVVLMTGVFVWLGRRGR